jgi:hypothetical protein
LVLLIFLVDLTLVGSYGRLLMLEFCVLLVCDDADDEQSFS